MKILVGLMIAAVVMIIIAFITLILFVTAVAVDIASEFMND